MHIIFRLLKKTIVMSFFIYGFNLLSQSIGIIIPLNLYTISYTTLFGLNGFLSLVIILIYGF